jgi:hypothetical protein
VGEPREQGKASAVGSIRAMALLHKLRVQMIARVLQRSLGFLPLFCEPSVEKGWQHELRHVRQVSGVDRKSTNRRNEVDIKNQRGENDRRESGGQSRQTTCSAR